MICNRFCYFCYSSCLLFLLLRRLVVVVASSWLVFLLLRVVVLPFCHMATNATAIQRCDCFSVFLLVVLCAVDC